MLGKGPAMAATLILMFTCRSLMYSGSSLIWERLKIMRLVGVDEFIP